MSTEMFLQHSKSNNCKLFSIDNIDYSINLVIIIGNLFFLEMTILILLWKILKKILI